MHLSKLCAGSGHRDKVRAFCFDPHSPLCYSSGWDGTVRQWDLATIDEGGSSLEGTDEIVMLPSKCIYPPSNLPSLAPSEPSPHNFSVNQDSLMSNPAITTLIFGVSLNLIIFGDKAGYIRIWDPDTHSLQGSLKTPHPEISALYIDESHNILYSGGSDGIICAWHVSSQPQNASRDRSLNLRLHLAYYGPKQAIHCIHLDALHSLLLCSGDESDLYVWRLSSPNIPLHIIRYPEKKIFSFDIYSEKSHLVCVGQKKAVYVIDYRRNELLRKIAVSSPLSLIEFDFIHQSWLGVDFEGHVLRFSSDGSQILERIPLDHKGVTLGKFNFDQSRLIVSYNADSHFQIHLFQLCQGLGN